MSEIIPVVDETNPQVRAAFTATESPLPTLGPNLGNGTTSAALTGLTVGQLYVVRAVGGTFTSATLDGTVIQVNTTRRATSFRATATDHTVALTGGTAGAITVQQITAPAGAPVQFQGVSLRGALLEAGVTSNYAIGSATSHRWATDAVSCIAIGARTHENLINATSNIAIGSNSQREVTSGGGNVSVGVNSLRNVVLGFQNVAVGSRSGHAFVSGAYNTSIGRAAGDVGQADVSGSVQIGTDNTGTGAFTTADNQIALGTPLHSMKCGAVDGETGFWALGVAKAGTATAPASPTYLTVKVDGQVHHLQVGPGGSGGIAPSLIDAKGDLLVGTANDTVARLPVSGVAGRVLTEDPTEPAGVKWAAPAGQILPSRWALRLPGTAGNFVSTPNPITYSGLTEIDLRWVGTLTNFATANIDQTFFGQLAANQWGLAFTIGQSFGLILRVSANGTSWGTNALTIPYATFTGYLTANTIFGMRGVWRADNGSGSPDLRIFTSDDEGATWTLRGTQSTGITATPHPSTAPLQVGEIAGASTMNGLLLRASVRTDTGSGLTLRAEYDARDGIPPRYSDPQGNTWTVNGSAWSGRKGV